MYARGFVAHARQSNVFKERPRDCDLQNDTCFSYRVLGVIIADEEAESRDNISRKAPRTCQPCCFEVPGMFGSCPVFFVSV